MKSNIHRKMTHQYKNETTKWHQCHKRLNRKKFRLNLRRESLIADVLDQCKEVSSQVESN